MGILNAEGSFGLLLGEVTTAPLVVFPLSLIPTYLVPVGIMRHLPALRQVLGTAVERGPGLKMSPAA